MAHEKALSLRRITKVEAERAFAACAGLDPEGEATPESAAQAGECFAVKGRTGEVSLSVIFRGGVAWIQAAAGGGESMAGPTLEKIESLARAQQCFIVAFQTIRPGLQRVAVRRGYAITEKIGAGWKLTKHL